MIGRDDVLDLVVVALPVLPEGFDEDSGTLPYIDAGQVAGLVVDLVSDGRADELGAFFAVLERLHAEGDDHVRELATIGYLEGLQNLAGHRGLDPEAFVPLLGPESLRWWRGLDAFWAGEAPAVLPTD